MRRFVCSPPEARILQPFGYLRTESFCTCHAKQIDVVSNLIYRLADLPLPKDPPEMKTKRPVSILARQLAHRQVTWMRACESLALESEGSRDSNGSMTPERFEQFWRTMVCDLHVHKPGYSADSSMGEAYAQYQHYMFEIFEPHDKKFYREHFHLSLIVEPALDSFAGHRHFCTTEKGRLARFPLNLKRGMKYGS